MNYRISAILLSLCACQDVEPSNKSSTPTSDTSTPSQSTSSETPTTSPAVITETAVTTYDTGDTSTEELATTNLSGLWSGACSSPVYGTTSTYSLSYNIEVLLTDDLAGGLTGAASVVFSNPSGTTTTTAPLDINVTGTVIASTVHLNFEAGTVPYVYNVWQQMELVWDNANALTGSWRFGGPSTTAATLSCSLSREET